MWYTVGASDFFGYCLIGDGYAREWSNKAKLACDSGSTVRWEPWKQCNFAHSNGDNRDTSMTWSTMADVVRIPHAVFLRGDASEVESNGGHGETPTHCVIVVATARHPAMGSDLVVFTLSNGVWCCSGGLLGACGLFLLGYCRRRITS